MGWVEHLNEGLLPVLTLMSAVTAAVVALRGLFGVSKLRIEINHRMDMLLETSRKLANAEGRSEGRAEVNQENKDAKKEEEAAIQESMRGRSSKGN